MCVRARIVLIAVTSYLYANPTHAPEVSAHTYSNTTLRSGIALDNRAPHQLACLQVIVPGGVAVKDLYGIVNAQHGGWRESGLAAR